MNHVCYNSDLFPSAVISPRFREFHQDFFPGENNLLLQDNLQLEKANAFFKLLERKLGKPEGNPFPLQILLKRAVQISDQDVQSPVFVAMKQAFFKQKGYLARLFSQETWDEWTENRTSLGKVVALFMDFVASQTQIRLFVKQLNEQEIQQANKEAKALLKRICFHKITKAANRNARSWYLFHFLMQSNCATSLIGGITASIVTKNPLPLLLGFCVCFPKTYAQQKIGNEFQVNTYTNSSQERPLVTSLSNSNFVVTWQSNGQDGSSWGVYGQLFDGNGSNIGSEFRANTYTTNYQWNPSVASLANGNFVVIWRSAGQDGSAWGIFGQLFAGFGSKIGNEFQVNTYTINMQEHQRVTILSNGNFVVTWESYGQDSSGRGVFGQLFAGNGSKIGNEFQVNTYTDGDQMYPSGTSLGNSSFVVTWTSWGQDGPSSGIFGQLFAGNGSRIGNEFQVNTYTNSSQSGSSVIILRNGNFVITWGSSDQDNSEWGIFGQSFAGNGSRIGNEFQVNTYTNLDQRYPSATSLSNGNFVVAWYSKDQDGSEWGIFGQLFAGNGSRIGNEFQMNTYTNDDQNWKFMTSLSNGNFVVTWRSYGQDGSGYGVFGQLFAGNATKIGNEFQINTYTNSSQEWSPVTSLSNGNFVVTWQSNGQDGSGYGIFGQIFNDSIFSSSTSSFTTTSSSVSSSVSSSSSSSTTSSSSTSRIISSTINTATTPSYMTSGSTTSDQSRTSSISTFRSSSLASSKTFLPSTIDSTSRRILPSQSKPNNRLLWPWFVLGAMSVCSCISILGYLIKRHLSQKNQASPNEQGLSTFTLSPEREGHTYRHSKTPDFVTADPEQHYSKTPDFVTADPEQHYSKTPDFVTAEPSAVASSDDTN